MLVPTPVGGFPFCITERTGIRNNIKLTDKRSFKLSKTATGRKKTP